MSRLVKRLVKYSVFVKKERPSVTLKLNVILTLDVLVIVMFKYILFLYMFIFYRKKGHETKLYNKSA